VPHGWIRPTPVWTCFLAGYLSHLVADSLTEHGVPWLWPFGGNMGLPPWRTLRIKTGGWFEHLVVLPGLWALVFWMWHQHLPEAVAILKSLGAGAR
jgi:membrane-bound metal-dependent hydrolase YbcI (DUF457 family)